MTTNYFKTNSDSGYCRLCANLTPEVDLIDIIGNKNSLECKILQCLQLQIDEHDCLPKQACTVCESKVCSFYEFYEQVIKAQQILSEPRLKVEDESPIYPIPELNNSDASSNSCEEALNTKDENDSEDENENQNENENDNDLDNSDSSEKLKDEIDIQIDRSRTKVRNGPRKKDWSEEETVSDIEEMRKNFYIKLSGLSKNNNSNLIPDERYARLIREVEEAKTKSKKMSLDYRRLSRFEVLTVNDSKKLIVPRTKSNNKIRYFVTKSEVFDCIRNAHVDSGHGGRTRTEGILKTKFKNISRELVMIYLNLCKICRIQRKAMKESLNSSADKITTSKDLKLEDTKSVNNYDWKCNECNEILPSVNDLRDHFDSIHQKPVEFVCIECTKVYNNYITFRNHVLAHRNKYRFRCDVCDNYYSSAKKLQNHKERHNQTRKKYFCPTCGKGFLNESYLSVHARRKHSTNPIPEEQTKTHECDVCHKMFSSVSSLNNHKKVHTGVREHTCEHCGKSFIYKKYLDDHITSHSDERPFKCEVCPASFKAKMYLRRHQFLHSGIKPYQCDVCGKKFPRKPALIEHSITHTDLYPFKCEICDKGFRSKKNVIWHQRLHTGEKPYSCLMCNRHFTCSSNYDKHMKRHHGVVKVKREFIMR